MKGADSAKGRKMHEGENKIVKGETKDYGGE